MKSITIHKMDDEMGRILDSKAAAEGLSLNALVKCLLRKTLGLEPGERNHRQDFAVFCGKWDAREADEFDRAVEGFGEIDEELWR